MTNNNLEDLQSVELSRNRGSPNEIYNCLIRHYFIVNKHKPLKTKVIRCNNAPFINEWDEIYEIYEINEIYKRSGLKNKYVKHSKN